MKAGGGAKRNASIEQGTQVSTAAQRAVTTTRHRHTDKLSGDTYHGQPRGRIGEGQTAAQMHKYELEIARPPERVRVIER